MVFKSLGRSLERLKLFTVLEKTGLMLVIYIKDIGRELLQKAEP